MDGLIQKNDAKKKKCHAFNAKLCLFVNKDFCQNILKSLCHVSVELPTEI